MRTKIAWLLVALIALSLLATSIVSARSLTAPLRQDVMSYPLITIPEGSTHTDFDGDYVTNRHQAISLTSGWSYNLPSNTCAVSVRFGFNDSYENYWGALMPSADDAVAVLARIQTANVWSDQSGIVPINTYPPTLYLDMYSNAYIYIVLTGYWVCDDYMPPPRPTPAP